ncbi:hypothetical protein DP44_3467 [Burkholderia pseudomallei]|nr:hypothetical protein DP44_3467 [Burkholderia pseudomallei]
MYVVRNYSRCMPRCAQWRLGLADRREAAGTGAPPAAKRPPARRAGRFAARTRRARALTTLGKLDFAQRMAEPVPHNEQTVVRLIR